LYYYNTYRTDRYRDRGEKAGYAVAKQARSEQTRVHLLAAAAELLRRDGYEACSMTDISRAAGVTKGGLYFHYSSKDEMCDAVQAAAIAVLQAFIEKRDAHEPSAVRRLIYLTHALMRWLGSEPVVGASFRMAREMGERHDRFLAFSRAWYAQVQRYINDAEDLGELNKNAPLEISALLVAVMCVGAEAMVSTKTADRDMELVKAVTNMWELVKPGLISDRGGPGSPSGGV
jgi:AcrR family transcriptional regulator